MGFLSYAQNFEDVMLWRALGHVSNGMYVDIGAQHPRIDSVSRSFYERGWRGVHVEPVPAFAQLLRADRPDETVLQVALGEREGTLELNVFADTGLSTAIASYAERHQVERGYAVERIQTPVLTMKSALEWLAGKDVHWLKIDVEGFEEQVLRGWDSERLRPWILVVEATVPNSTETDYEKWDPLVIAAGYRFVYFDGLNRFYIANEHPELAAAFSAPPNIFDAVEVSGQASWGLCNFAVAQHQGQVDTLTERLQARDAELVEAKARIESLEAALVVAQARTKSVETALAGAQAWAQSVEAALSLAQARIQSVEAALAEAAARRRALDEERADAVARASQLETQLAAVSREATTAGEKAEELKHTSYYWWHTAEELRKQVDALTGELGHVYTSKSWRLTEPLRLVNVHAKRGRRFVGRVARWALRQTGRVTGRNGAMPGAGKAAAPVVVVSQAGSPVAVRRLPPRAARLYAELKQLVEGETE
jgi:FkbM family methyltransferase